MRALGAFLLLGVLVGCAPASVPSPPSAPPPAPEPIPEPIGEAGRPLAIVGGTLVDLSSFGRSSLDIQDSVVVIEEGRITAAGPRGVVEIPRRARTLDARGAFLVPGLIDGFAAQANQAFANAHLYEGVTSVVAGLPSARSGLPPDPRRGDTFEAASLSPRLFLLEVISGSVREGEAFRPMTEDEARAEVDRLAQAGAKVLLLHYRLRPGPFRAALARAKELGLATFGELGFTSYYEAQNAGVDAFVHTGRYSLEIAPPELRQQVAAGPFGPARRTFYEYLAGLAPDDPRVVSHANRLAGGRTLLMPTLSLMYLEIPGHGNPWKERVARILDPKDIHQPADPATGEPPPPADPARDGLPPGLGTALLALERQYQQAGARYLAGSGTSAFGTMPGISLHTELELLVRIGLSPRQALAAATTNFSALAPWRSLGRIAPGNEADLLILEADPAVDIRNARRIRTLLLDGREINREGLLAGSQ